MLNLLAKPNVLLKLEGLSIFVLSLVVYDVQGFSWYSFLWLFLVPDLAMLFYLFNPLVGAAAYNLTHNKVFPAVLAIIGLMAHNDVALMLAVVWFAHIGFDRMLGYGLKFPDSFSHTHLGMIGKGVKLSKHEE
ncbi:DUF4260 domain-containing protein [Hydrogenovibrio marinus]|uniref:DUF4260 domain-containing protein n=1 Tax=Hydrogenovibrio marinus TaxID=28885 RepID=A0A066ZN96_HYDMR|nr:DUF4260 domain-containing protein [Hydrogenovibrio marinus]KDN95278.1 hypothetical protein EI16_02945 [Hydrogenovibrio marinus]BBN59757.1 hypothetical protein HVMH_1351 [Hydrogenovibrio marinus]